MRLRDLVGSRFGRLVVVERDMTCSSCKKIRWICRCDCGTIKSIQGANLPNGTTRSCGCLRAEVSAARRRMHGRSGSPEHRIWTHMRARCLNPADRAFGYYGGRGITICERWASSFANFLADMGERPSPQHQIERRDNDGPYAPENCLWASRQDQVNNTRRNHRLTYQGRTMTIAQWSAETGISYKTIYSRLHYGWPVERVLGAPVRPW